MNVATAFDRERSLEAMWHAYRASDFVAQSNVALDTGVVRDLLIASLSESAPLRASTLRHVERQRHCVLTALLPHSPPAPLALIGIDHLSISLSTNFCKYSGDRRSGTTSSAPYSFIRA